MLRYFRLFEYSLIIALLVIFVGSCSSGDLPNLPGDLNIPNSARMTGSQGGHACLGLYDIYISADRKNWEVVPRRAGMSHLNIIPLLEGSDPPFLRIPENGIVFEEDFISATVEIEHPSFVPFPGFDPNYFMAFDVKGIVMFPGTLEFPNAAVISQDPLKGEGRVLNAEGYSRWWNPVEFQDEEFLRQYVEGKLAIPQGGSATVNATLHPFRYIFPASSTTRQQFPANKTAQTIYNLVLPEEGNPFALMYAIDASYGEPTLNLPGQPIMAKDFEFTANQPEPYKFEITKLENGMWGDGEFQGGGSCQLEIKIYDWQDATKFVALKNVDGLRRVFVDAPQLFPDAIEMTPAADSLNIKAEATTTTPVAKGALEAGIIVLNAVEVSYGATPETNFSKDNAKHIATVINTLTGSHHVSATGLGDGTLFLQQTVPGIHEEIRINDTPNLPLLGLDTIGEYQNNSNPPPPGYYVVTAQPKEWNWSATIPNTQVITPGTYQVLISAVDGNIDPLFPGPENRCTAYYIVPLDVQYFEPYLCGLNLGLHNQELGTGVITNAKPEYKAACDFIDFPGSPYLGRLIFNLETQPGDGVQQIAVMFVDTPQATSALPLITIEGFMKGIPILLKEDGYNGNIIVVNHTHQDTMLVYDYMGDFLVQTDHGDGDGGYNAPIAMDFSDDGSMWTIGHRGSQGAVLMHWYWDPESGPNGNYLRAVVDEVDLTPFFGDGYNIYDLKVLPSENLLVIFGADQNGHVEYFDISKTPPEVFPDRQAVNIYPTPLNPLHYPGLRITKGGGLMIDRIADPDLARCRIVTAANFITGPLVLTKLDFWGHPLNSSAFTFPILSIALSNDDKEYKRNMVAFPFAETANYRLYAPPVSGW